MLKMKIARVDRNNDNVPILSNIEIDRYAHEVLRDYNPDLLSEPGAIEFEDFLEDYLGMMIIYKDIFYERNTPPIYGRTIFRDSSVKVFNREESRVSETIFWANTVILDNFLIDKESMEKFTGLHEGGHILMHQGVYSIYKAGQTCCRRGNVGSVGGNGPMRTADQWLDYQANYFVGAIAMPNVTFVPFIHEVLSDYDVRKGKIVLGYDDDLDIVARDLLPERIADIYKVSKQAAFIKLKKSGFIVEA